MPPPVVSSVPPRRTPTGPTGKAASTSAARVAASLRVLGKVPVVVPAIVPSVPVSAAFAVPESPVVAITVGVMTAPAATALKGTCGATKKAMGGRTLRDGQNCRRG